MIKVLYKAFVKNVSKKYFAQYHKQYQAALNASVYNEPLVIMLMVTSQNINMLM